MIREIKRDILKVWICLCHNDEGKYMLEISSFALSFVYFEILIFQKVHIIIIIIYYEIVCYS